MQLDSALDALGVILQWVCLRSLLCSGQRWAEDCRGQATDAQELLVSLVSQDQPTLLPLGTHTQGGLIAICDDSRLVCRMSLNVFVWLFSHDHI